MEVLGVVVITVVAEDMEEGMVEVMVMLQYQQQQHQLLAMATQGDMELRQQGAMVVRLLHKLRVQEVLGVEEIN